MFDELKVVKLKYFKEIKQLKKAEAYLEPKRASNIELFCE